MEQVLQLTGAIAVLSAFVANQRRRLSSDSVLFLSLNAAGTGLLAVLAGLDEDWGFLLLEGTWSTVSTVGLVAAWRRRQAAGSRTSAATGVEKE